MLQDEANKITKDTGKNIGKSLLRYAANLFKDFLAIGIKKSIAKVGRKTVYKLQRKTVNKPQKKTVKDLIRKNPREGICIEKGLNKEEVKFIARELAKMNQDFVVAKTGNLTNKGETEFSLTTVGTNKYLLESLKDKAKIKSNIQSSYQKKPSFDSILKDAKERTKKQSVKQAPTPIKYKTVPDHSR